LFNAALGIASAKAQGKFHVNPSLPQFCGREDWSEKPGPFFFKKGKRPNEKETPK